jgi:hypothetical protein
MNVKLNYHSARRIKKYVALVLAIAENAYRPSPTEAISCIAIPRVKQFNKRNTKIEITTFSKPALLNTSLRERKQSETKTKEECCWAITMRQRGYAAACRVPVCYEFGFHLDL